MAVDLLETSSEHATPELTPEVLKETAAIYQRVRHIIPEIEWPVHAPYIAAIRKLKLERKAIILAHNYQTPEIFHGVADLTGDSLALAREAAKANAEVIVMCGVHFMAETAKLMNPSKTVLIPDLEAGCSLAASIKPEDIRQLRSQYPGVPVVTYVNTSAEVKAESDICCTSANALEVVESMDSDRVIFLPDEFLGRYVASQTKKEVILWKGHCEVHEKFTAKDLRTYREQLRRHRDSRPSGMPSRCAGRGRLCGIYRRHDPGSWQTQTAARADGHRMLHERQRRRGISPNRIYPPLQSLSAHETDNAAQDPGFAAIDEARSGSGSPGCRPCARGSAADAGD